MKRESASDFLQRLDERIFNVEDILFTDIKNPVFQQAVSDFVEFFPVIDILCQGISFKEHE